MKVLLTFPHLTLSRKQLLERTCILSQDEQDPALNENASFAASLGSSRKNLWEKMKKMAFPMRNVTAEARPAYMTAPIKRKN